VPGLGKRSSEEEIASVGYLDSRAGENLGRKRGWNLRWVSSTPAQESNSRATVNVAEAIPEAEETIFRCSGVAP
jgi:hypothetical protein